MGERKRAAGGARPNPQRQRKGPLRAVVKVLRRSAGMYSDGLVLLDCGHRVPSRSTARARCDQCPE